MKTIASTLVQPRTDGFVGHCSLTALAAVAGSLALSWFVAALWPSPGISSTASGWLGQPSPYLRLVIASAMETAVLATLADILLRLRVSPFAGSVFLAVAFGGLSAALLGATFFLQNAWVYFLAAAAYFSWQGRSEWHGALAVGLPVLLVNLAGLALELLGGA